VLFYIKHFRKKSAISIISSIGTLNMSNGHRPKWLALHKAFIIYTDSHGFLHRAIRVLLAKIFRSNRSLDSVRTMLAKLRRDSVLYDVQLKRWTVTAIHMASCRVHKEIYIGTIG
jgi:hypothetical protein